MIDQGSSLAISRGCDQIPDEALDILISFVMIETVHKDRPTDGFYILLGELTFVASVGKDVCPPSPAEKQIFSLQTVSLILGLGFYCTIRV